MDPHNDFDKHDRAPAEPVQGDTLELIEHHKKDCNRYTNSFCSTVHEACKGVVTSTEETRS